MPLVEGVTLRALLTGRYFGNGPPRWRVHCGRQNERRCFSAAEAIVERQKLIRKLQLQRRTDARVGSLTRRLRCCRPMKRCLSAACPVCTRAFQRWFVEVGDSIGKRMARRSEKPRFLSIVPDFGRVQPDELTDFDFERFRLRTLEALRESGIVVKLGALDVSLNHWRGSRDGAYYQFQWELLIAEAPKRSRQRLAALVNASGKVRKPVLQKKKKWPRAALGYCVKSKITRRESFRDTSVVPRGRAPCINTRGRDLLGADLAALMVVFDGEGLHQRLLLWPS